MSYKVKVVTKDSEEVFFECEEGESVLAAAERNNIIFPSGCKSGGCGNCIGTCSSGDYDLKNYSASVLSEENIKNGGILMCQTFPQTNLEVEVAYDKSKILFQQLSPNKAKVTEVVFLNETTVKLVIQTEDFFSFVAGQYVDLVLNGIKRSYSLSNSPNFENKLEFLIKIKEGGLFSEELKNVKENDEIIVFGPLGNFMLDEQSLSPKWFVAGGTGLAPIVSMLKTMAEFNNDSEVNLYFGVNNLKDLFFVDELDALKKTLKLKVFISINNEESQYYKGFPSDLVSKDLKETNQKPDIYICGPDALLNKIKEIARENNISPEKVFFELFA